MTEPKNYWRFVDQSAIAVVEAVWSQPATYPTKLLTALCVCRACEELGLMPGFDNVDAMHALIQPGLETFSGDELNSVWNDVYSRAVGILHGRQMERDGVIKAAPRTSLRWLKGECWCKPSEES